MTELFLILERAVLHIVAGLTLAFLSVVILTALFLFGLLALEIIGDLIRRKSCKCKGEKCTS